MVIYDLAMKLKLEGEEFYKNHAEKEEHEGIRQIFKILAAEERRHYEIIRKIENFTFAYISSDTLEKAKKVLLREGLFNEENNCGKLQVNILNEALEKQQDCLYIYRRLADELEYDYERETFKKLIKDSMRHIMIINNMKEYII